MTESIVGFPGLGLYRRRLGGRCSPRCSPEQDSALSAVGEAEPRRRPACWNGCAALDLRAARRSPRRSAWGWSRSSRPAGLAAAARRADPGGPRSRSGRRRDELAAEPPGSAASQSARSRRHAARPPPGADAAAPPGSGLAGLRLAPVGLGAALDRDPSSRRRPHPLGDAPSPPAARAGGPRRRAPTSARRRSPGAGRRQRVASPAEPEPVAVSRARGRGRGRRRAEAAATTASRRARGESKGSKSSRRRTRLRKSWLSTATDAADDRPIGRRRRRPARTKRRRADSPRQATLGHGYGAPTGSAAAPYGTCAATAHQGSRAAI